MSSIYGDNLTLSIFGQSHAPAIGMTLDGIPAGLPVDGEKLQRFLNRRAPGQNSYSTTRREADAPEFICGIVDDHTCGAPITALIRNTNTRSGDYSDLKDHPRPGHADYTAQIKYGGFQDVAGGGHFSGRLTAPLCIAGGMCKQWLESKGIEIHAYIKSIAAVEAPSLCTVTPDFTKIDDSFPVADNTKGNEMQAEIAKAKENGDSVGGVIECMVTGLPAGLGEPMFEGIESKLAQIIFGVPAVKGLEFGSGFYGSTLLGSQNNDPYTIKDGLVVTETNNAGGILGGITNGMPLVFRAAIKPTPSISRPQQTISISNQEVETLQIQGRHDPCIVPRAVPVMEACAAIALFDLMIHEF